MTYSSIQMKIERTGTTVTMYARPISDPAMDWSTLYTVTGASTDAATVSFTTHNNTGNAITVWWDNFTVVPEPVTVVLMLIGGFLVRRRY
jgi:hypothetical protein